jgi:hypothetical protein
VAPPPRRKSRKLKMLLKQLLPSWWGVVFFETKGVCQFEIQIFFSSFCIENNPYTYDPFLCCPPISIFSVFPDPN